MLPIRSTLNHCLAGLLSLGRPALLVGVSTQTLTFEQVGDVAFDAESIGFDSDETLWGMGTELRRFLQGASAWDFVNDANGMGRSLLVLSSDTLFLTSMSAVHRSTDGGKTFSAVYTEGSSLFAADLEGSNSGVILAGTRLGGTGISYSTNRGDSFIESLITEATSSPVTLNTAVEIPDGVASGRLVAGAFGGLLVSEDSGQTWAPSSLFQEARYDVLDLVVGTDHLTDDRKLFASLTDSQQPDYQLYSSDDDGLTWQFVTTRSLRFLMIFVPSPGIERLLSVDGGTGLEGDYLTLHESIDGGETWTETGELPAEANGGFISTHDMLIGPDGKLYISVLRAGSTEEWVYRSTEPIVVANAPEARPEESFGELRVFPNPAAGAFTIEAPRNFGEAVITDMRGRVVSQIPLIGGRSSFDATGLPVGVYVVTASALSTRITVSR